MFQHPNLSPTSWFSPPQELAGAYRQRPAPLLRTRCAAALFLLPAVGLAHDFEVTTAAEFEAALDTAAFNAEDDRIHLADGTYSIADAAGAAFQYVPFGSPRSLEIYGDSPEDVIISGAGLDQVLVVSGGSLLTIRNVTIRDGNAPSGTRGGGLYAQDTNVYIENVNFAANHSAQSGGAVGTNHFKGNITIENSRFTGNGAGSGCSIYNVGQDSKLTVNNSVFLEQSCGGRIILASIDQLVKIRNSTIVGSISMANQTAVYVNRSDLYLTNNVLANVDYGVTNNNNSYVELWNTAFVGNGLDVNGTFELTLFAFSSFIDPNKINEAPVVSLIDTISGDDPGFVDADNGDFRLSPSSILVNQGRSDAPNLLDVDLAGRPRVQGMSVDIGAYELQMPHQDADGDGMSDILWRNTASGQNWAYLMNGSIIAASEGINPVNTVWIIAGRGDYNGDGKADVLWRHSVSGQTWLHLMDGPDVISSVGVSTVPTVWEIAGSGDHDGDGRADILWRNAVTGQNWLYLMDGAAILGSTEINKVPPIWQIAGNGDYNGDGKADILWRHGGTGQVWLYLMDGSTISSSVAVGTIPTVWEIAGGADFDGDGKADVLWRHGVTGQNWMYLMDGATIQSSIGVNTVADLNWTIAGNGDYDGDGKADILWRNNVTGQNWMYLMNGASISSSEGVNTVSDLQWQIIDVN